MEFFETTPLGRILSRFSKDIDVLDNVLPMHLTDFIVCSIEVKTIEQLSAVTSFHSSEITSVYNICDV